MGRTYRTRRKRKSPVTCNQYGNGNLALINLTKWMYKNNWANDTKLCLKEFPETGRGITTKHRSYRQNDVLINVPFNLMISYNTLENSVEFMKLFEHVSENETTLTIHELLAVYLALEKYKKEQSFWYPYIESLPHTLPSLPWLLSATIYVPNDIKIRVDEQRTEFLTAWSKITRSIRSKNSLDRVLTIDLFRWSYTMVNTRAVYINPSTVLRQSTMELRRLLSDDPSMALCPYLDMFNHCSTARTEASTDDNLTFRLVTLTPYRRHRQVFISYGAHDNDKLMCEYGFYIDGNDLDCIRFKLDDVLQLNKCTKLQYNHVKSLDLEDELLTVRPMNISFALKQVLFILIRPNLRVNIWNSVTFSEQYTENDLRDIYNVVEKLVELRISLLKNELAKLTDYDDSKVLCTYIEYKIQFCQLCLQSFI